MSDIAILGALKFLALGIGLASTIWGMIRTTTFDDEGGRKRLTRAGHVAVALALGGFLIAISAYGFETLAKQAADTEEAAKAFRQEAREQRRDDDARRDRAERRARDAEARSLSDRQRLLSVALASEQRILTLTAANEQRSRDLALARDVNLRAQENLSRTGRALAQLERVLQPIGPIQMEVRWEIPISRNNRTLAELVARAAADRRVLEDTPGIVGWGYRGGRRRRTDLGIDRFEGGVLDNILIDRSSPIYLDSGFTPLEPRRRWRSLRDIVRGTTAYVYFVEPGGPPPAELARFGDRGLVRSGDLHFRIKLDESTMTTLTYYVQRNVIEVRLNQIIERSIARSGNIVSIPDLEQAMLVIDADPYGSDDHIPGTGPEDWMQSRMRLALVTISAAGRTYTFEGDRFHTAQGNAVPLYYLSPVRARQQAQSTAP